MTTKLAVFLMFVSLVGCSRPQKAVPADIVQLRAETQGRKLQTYEMLCEIKTVSYTKAVCQSDDLSIWSIYLPPGQPLGKKYRVIIQEVGESR